MMFTSYKDLLFKTALELDQNIEEVVGDLE